MVRVGMWLAVLGLWGTAAAVGKSPNVVLIVSDDHAWGDYSFMGHPHVRTPSDGPCRENRSKLRTQRMIKGQARRAARHRI